MNNLKNMLVLKDLPSNLIEEAYVVLNPNLKLKIKEINKKEVDRKDETELEECKTMENNYILNEAKYVLINYISKFESKNEILSKKSLEKKYRLSKKLTTLTLFAFFLYIIITNIF